MRDLKEQRLAAVSTFNLQTFDMQEDCISSEQKSCEIFITFLKFIAFLIIKIYIVSANNLKIFFIHQNFVIRLMPGSYKVYISSTYKDLKEQREAAAKAARALGLQTVAMEDYTSTEQKPVDKCREDVKSCDFYIGIFAFRYGHIPEGYDKSITQLEYEAAGEARIPRLIFLIDDDAPWPRSMNDKPSIKIDEFREFLQKQHVVTPLKNLGELGFKVTAALSNELNKKPGPTISLVPSILPYLNNRGKQQEELIALLYECESTLHQKPLVGIIHGDEHECHDTFIEKLQGYLLPELLNLAPDKNSISKFHISWPNPSSPVHQRISLLKNHLFRFQTGKHDGALEDLIQVLNARLTPLLIYSTIQAGEWQKHEPELINQWIQFWNELPDLAVGKKLFLFLCFNYKNIAGLNRSEAKKYQNLNGQMCDFVNKLNLKQYENVNGIVLSELRGIAYEDLHEWIVKYAAVYCDSEALRFEIDQFFKQQKMSAICMCVLAKKLRECLKSHLKLGV